VNVAFWFLPIFSLAVTAQAETPARLRTATAAEIKQYWHGASDLSGERAGYQYLPGGSVGYKISDGKICVRKQSTADCADVFFDGKRLEMIDRRGNRDIISE
jgi:hypothetical protein